MFDEMGPLATMADAHREWHWNTGVPIGQAGCPQDACHPFDEYDMEDDEPTTEETAPRTGRMERHLIPSN